MAERYRSKHAVKTKPSKIIIIIIIVLVALAAALGTGAYFLLNNLIAPDSSPAETSAMPSVAADTEAASEVYSEAPTEPSAAAKAKAYIAGMSEYEKICQLFIVTPEVLTGEDGVTLAGEQTKASIEKYPVGGIVYFSSNLVDPEQTKAMISNSQSYSKTPLFICVDEEGGSVARVAGELGTTEFDDMFSYHDQGSQTAYDNAKTIANDISRFGFNLDFAPVADVWTNPDNTVIAERAYSDDYTQAADLVSAAVSGFNDGGVIPVLKHFPGHGDTIEDSHFGLAAVGRSVDEIKKEELLPFIKGIDSGTGMVMAGHLTVQALDPDKPATLSSIVVPELLRGELGYDGVVITDSVSMQAITDNFRYDEIVKGIFDADIDMILCPTDLDVYIGAVEAALKDGKITNEQLEKKLLRILTLKYERGIMNI